MNMVLEHAQTSGTRPLGGLAAALLFVAGSMLLAPAAEAQEIPSPYEFIEETQAANVFIGYLFTAGGPADINIGSAVLFGGRYDVRLGGPAMGEVSFGLGPAQRPVRRPTGGQETEHVGDEAALLGLLEAGVKLVLTGPRTWNDLAPYVVGTGGVAADLLRRSEIEEEHEIPRDARFHFGPTLAVGLGAGTDWFPTPRLSVRVDVRDYIWRVTPPAGLTDPDLDAEWTNNIGLTVGAAFHF